MVLFTFAALLSEPPVENNAPTETDQVSLQQASDATSKDTSSGESNISYAAPPETDKSDYVVEQKKTEDSKPVERSVNNPDSIDESESTSAAKENIGSDASDTTITSSYQDDEWLNGVRIWTPILTDDMNTISTYATNMDIEGLDSRSRLFRSDCTFALQDSKKYTVSPKFEESKSEYESSLADYMIAADEIQKAVEKINNNDFDAATEYLKTASAYMVSGSEHTTNAANSLKAAT